MFWGGGVGLQVLVSTKDMCWGMTLGTHLVVIMGTDRRARPARADTGYPSQKPYPSH